MTSKAPLILIPVENQVRELDAKILLACVAANRGFPSIIGSKRQIEMCISSFPRSVYLAKSLQHGHHKFFRIARKLGHKIVGWDEDALVHLPAETYYSRRLSPAALECVSHLFAWGEDNAELWRQYPDLPAGLPIHITGNPRNDLLRPEIQTFYNDVVKKVQETYGDFILINTNFNHVNAFSPDRRLFLPVDKPGDEPEFGRAARGMTREYAEGLRDHKQAIFEHFQKMIPALEKAFSDYTIVVRPHQVESQDIYAQIARGCQRVQVTNKYHVVPWLMASKAVILNGCTTSVEAYATGVPAISYRPVVNDEYDTGFYRLPNMLTHQCFDFDELRLTLGKILEGRLGLVNRDESKAIISHHLTKPVGQLACERIVNVLENILDDLAQSPKPSMTNRMTGRYKATKRRLRHQSKSRKAGSQKTLEHHLRKNPDISPDDLRIRIARFQRVLGEDRQLSVEQINANIFRIRA
jgi:surface carbohydrate biosynthesis protein